MSSLFTIALLCLQPALGEPVVDRCAMVEKNHFYSEDGRLVFIQLIAWDDDLPYPNRVVAWRMYDKIKPECIRDGNGWRLLFYDQAFDTMRVIHTPSFIETWTQFDPEVADRDNHPQCERRELRKP